MIVKFIIEAALILLILYGYIHEDQIIAFEQKIWKTICRKINTMIREYERRADHV